MPPGDLRSKRVVPSSTATGNRTRPSVGFPVGWDDGPRNSSPTGGICQFSGSLVSATDVAKGETRDRELTPPDGQVVSGGGFEAAVIIIIVVPMSEPREDPAKS